MKNPTKIRRTLAASALGLAAYAAIADTGTQSIEAIRQTAQSFVQARIPGKPNTVQVAVGNLDPRLRLAQCSEPLQASLPAGVVFKERVTVAVTSSSCACAVMPLKTIHTEVAIITLSKNLVRITEPFVVGVVVCD